MSSQTTCPPTPLPQPKLWNPFSGEPKPNQHPIFVPMTPREQIEESILNKELDLKQMYNKASIFINTVKNNNPLLQEDVLQLNLSNNIEFTKIFDNIEKFQKELEELEKFRIIITSRPL